MQTCFQNKFSTAESAKYRKHMNVNVHSYGPGTSRGQNLIPKKLFQLAYGLFKIRPWVILSFGNFLVGKLPCTLKLRIFDFGLIYFSPTQGMVSLKHHIVSKNNKILIFLCYIFCGKCGLHIIHRVGQPPGDG